MTASNIAVSVPTTIIQTYQQVVFAPGFLPYFILKQKGPPLTQRQAPAGPNLFHFEMQRKSGQHARLGWTRATNLWVSHFQANSCLGIFEKMVTLYFVSPK
jgi:hypothetical protein